MKEISLTNTWIQQLLEHKAFCNPVHEEKKPFGCTICGASFKQNKEYLNA